MKKSVRIIAFALVAVMVCLAFAACGKTLSGEYTAEIGITSIAGGKTTYKFSGSKVTITVVAGIAVFLGIGRLSKTKKCRTGDPSELETDSLNVSEQQLPQEAEPASNDNIMLIF